MLWGWLLVGASPTACLDPGERDVHEKGAAKAEVADAWEARESELKESRAAHTATLTGALEPAALALAEADPVAAARIGRAPLRPPPIGRPSEIKLARSVEVPAAGLRTVSEGLLGTSQVVMLRAVRFGVERLNERVNFADPTWRDPNVHLYRLADFTDEVEFRLLTRGTDRSELLDAMEALAPNLEFFGGRLAGTSEAIAGQSLVHLRELIDRWKRLPAIVPEADRATWTATIARVEAVARTVEERYERLLGPPGEGALDGAERQGWRSQTAPPHPTRALHSLPERMGGEHLRHRWLREERLDTNSGDMFAGIETMLERYDQMMIEYGDAGTPDEPALVDPARCEATWSPLAALASGMRELQATAVDCVAVSGFFAGRPVTKGELALKLIDIGINEPTARFAQSQHAPAIGLTASVQARRAHRLLAGVSVAIAAGDKRATVAAIRRARAALCTAGLVVWLHGEAGEEEKISSWVGRYCPDETEAQWRAVALGDPRGGVPGLSIARVAGGPADMVGPMIYPWAPLGIQTLLATPKGKHPDGARTKSKAPELIPKIEPIRPGEALPPMPGAPTGGTPP